MANSKKSKVLSIVWVTLSWLAVAGCMGAIFFFSHQSGDDSAQQSMSAMGAFTEFILKYIGHNAFRKIAHFSEYCALSFLLYNALYAVKKKHSRLWAFLAAFIYSVSDEIHQYFVPGRACRFFDLCVDMSGILFGIAVFCLLAAAVQSIKKRLSKKRHKNVHT